MIRKSWEEAKSRRSTSLLGPSAAPFSEYRFDPVGFFEDVLAVDPWEKQRLMARAAVERQRVLAYTCNGAGKSTWLSWMVLWFMSTRRDARVITTAGVGAQVRALWRKIRGYHTASRRPLPGTPMTTQWELAPEWFALGFSTDAEESMQGYHSVGTDHEPGSDGGLLAVIDEASGVEPWVFNAMRGYMTTENCYWLVMGNPNKAGTEFHNASLRGDWERFQISAFDVPEHIISRSWIEEQRTYWGEDSPQWTVRILGQFPDVGGDFLVFPLSYFDAVAELAPSNEDGMHLGVDVARGNADRCTFVVTSDCKVIHAEAFHTRDTMRVVKHVEVLCSKFGVPHQNVHIDVIGIGSGVVDRLREKGKMVDAVDFGAKPLIDWPDLVGRDVKVLNRRAELYWIARQALNEERASVPEDYRDTIWKESNLIQYEVTDSGKVKIEPKDRIRARYDGNSPDYADAWVMTFSRARNRARVMVA